MQNKVSQPNVIPATAVALGSVTNSAIHTSTWGSGLRLFVNVANAVTAADLDSIYLCAVSPSGLVVPIAGFVSASCLSVNGIFTAEFYPGAWLPPSMAYGKLIGVAGIYLPLKWLIRLVMGAGSSATITVDAEILP